MAGKMEQDIDQTQARRNAIRELIRNQRIETQEHLRELLAERGFEVTQATLSRDLARLEARRVSLPEGGTAYEIPGAPQATASRPDFSSLRDMIFALIETDTLVVIQTRTGTASPVALGIDESRFEEVAGTLAGDDTIFVAPAKGISPSRLKKLLEAAYGFTTRAAASAPRKSTKTKSQN
jgi:transcriptional regulator of arginine metabolism